MNMKRAIALGLATTLIASSLTGCAGDSEVKNLKNIDALGAESSVSNNNYALSYTDQQELVYAQVSNRTLLDLSTLSACSDADLMQVTQYMDGVDDQLVGNTKPAILDSVFKDLTNTNDTGAIDEQFTNYLLAEFEKTPYYWQRSNMKVRGIDAQSKSIVVDVTYKTIDYKKEVKPNSSIVKGSPSYDEIEKNRYNKFCEILDYCKNNNLHLSDVRAGGSSDDSMLQEMHEALMLWINTYGEPEEVYKEQSLDSLTMDIYETGNQVTYNGLISSSADDSKGTMVVRYVLVPNYVLGINLGLTCKHLYIIDYKLDKDETEGKEVIKTEGYATVTDNIYELIYSYFKCVDESDFEGLYKLTDNFDGLDKYYSDMFNTSYNKHNNFTISLFNVQGTKIECGITVSSKSRAKGSNITMPIYTDRYYATINLVGDTLKLSNLTLLSRTIEGEPDIATESAGTTGFNKELDLTDDDKKAIEKLICDYSLYQVKSDTMSTGLEDILDYSLSTKDMTLLKENMASLSGKNKVVYLQNYMQGTKNYAKVKCKEQFQSDSGKVIEAIVTYDFIVKGGKWYIIGYNILSSVNLNASSLQTSGSLCLVSQDKVESYTSQVKNKDKKDIDEQKDISKSYDYESYTPVAKNNSSTNTAVSTEQMTDAQFKQVDSSYDTNIETFNSKLQGVTDMNALSSVQVYLACLTFVYNVENNNFTQESISARKSTIVTAVDTLIDSLNKDDSFKDIVNILESVKSKVEGA